MLKEQNKKGYCENCQKEINTKAINLIKEEEFNELYSGKSKEETLKEICDEAQKDLEILKEQELNNQMDFEEEIEEIHDQDLLHQNTILIRRLKNIRTNGRTTIQTHTRKQGPCKKDYNSGTVDSRTPKWKPKIKKNAGSNSTNKSGHRTDAQGAFVSE